MPERALHKLMGRLAAGLRARLAEGEDLRAIAASTAWLSGLRAVQLLASFVVSLWVARYLGPANFGVLAYAVAFVFLFVPLGKLGLEQIVVRELVRGAGERDELLGTAFALQSLGGLLVFALATGAAFVFRSDAPLVRTLVSVIALGNLFDGFNAIDQFFRSQVEAKPVAYARLFAYLLTTAGRLWLVLSGAPLLAFAWMGASEALLAAIGLSFVYRRSGHSMLRFRARLSRARSLMRDAWPFVLSGIVMTVYMRIDQLMLGSLVGDAEVGAYSVAIRVSEVGSFVAVAIATSTLPAIVAARQQDQARFYARLQTLYNAMALCGYLVAIPLTLLSEPLIRLLYGPAYAPAAPILVITSWSGVFFNLGIARTHFLTAMNWTRTHMVTVSLGALLNVGLNLWLIPTHGGRGAAIASLAAYWFATHGTCFVYPPLRRTGGMLTRALLWPRVW